ncbi:hypothetical protein O181_083960 [Austropuccinia psidii MF-1]|uniref:Uncharacterized protein n=1 Tax=Austropuccinia psidii MF-1 TaxID=1389203 RepID=A0A9Q3FP79_9BASI|nr:hypothetical protein [Austropuccinia psidii MF-1]
MGDAIREQSDDDQDPREEFLVEYQGETPIEIQDIQLEAGMPKDNANHQEKSCINCWRLTSHRTVWVTSRLHQDNVNFHMCHMRLSLKAQTHFHTIRNVWVITPHDATQRFGMLILVHEKTSAPPPVHLTPLPCLLSRLSGFHLPA